MSNKTEDQLRFNDREKLLLLFEKYRLGNITVEEQDIFMQLISEPAMETVLKDLIDDEIGAIDINNIPAEFVQPAERAAQLFQQILAEKKDTAPVYFMDTASKENNELTGTASIGRSGFRWLKYAAAVLLLISISVVLLRQDKSKDVLAVVPATDNKKSAGIVQPGRNSATLKLADGTLILLDTATNGFVSQEGNAAIRKESDGQLVYQLNAKNASAPVYNTLTTPSGGIFQLTLPDGTKVWLNAASSIRFPTAFPGDERKVEVSGEAYFEVAHNPSVPFRVNASNRAEIEVLGTHFNVNSYEEEKEMKVTLLEGKVQLSPYGPGEISNNQEKILRPGQQGRLNNSLHAARKGIETFSVSDNVDIEEVMAWTKGEFRFKNMPVDYLLRQAARWYDVQIDYKIDPSAITLSGVITRKDTIEKFLEIITATRKVRFSLKGRKITVEKFSDK